MKRGFLNSSKAKERPLGPAIATTSSVSKSAQDISPRSFPIGKVELTITEGSKTSAFYIQGRDSRLGSVANFITSTTLPLNAKPDEPVTECIFYPGSKEVVLNCPGFPQPLVHPTTPTFRLRAVPGKGMGLFSTRDLKMGDLILCERPLLVSPCVVPTDPDPSLTDEMSRQYILDMSEEYYAIAVGRMWPKDKVAFMALANSHTEDGSGPCSGIIRTNGLVIDGLLPSKTSLPRDIYSATCKDISRLNHRQVACSPNTMVQYDKPSLSFRHYAVRNIPAGEELTYSYLNSEMPTAERQKKLKPYGFVCTCSACTDPASDARRATLEPSMPNLFLWGIHDRTLPVDWMIRKSLQQLVLLTTEKMQQHRKYFEATSAIMDAYICLGDALNASKWAAKAHQQVWRRDDSDIDLELLDPTNTAVYEAHPFWRIRGASVLAHTSRP
ncbi:hypothetical protein C8R45DRAFT_1131511 [Mycena sanguinolenta]|nr:hypothetical protein C8R45DRAFT_1131511 [Mycena sanguinolenta]